MPIGVLSSYIRLRNDKKKKNSHHEQARSLGSIFLQAIHRQSKNAICILHFVTSFARI